MFDRLLTFSLGTLTLFVCMNSSLMIYLYSALNNWYFMSHLYFWHSCFYIGPLLILVVGVYKLVVIIYAVGISVSGFHFLYIVTPILLSLSLIVEIATNYVFWEIKTQLTLGNPGPENVINMLIKYNDPQFPEITEAWDHIQHQLRCCGGSGWTLGYSDYRNTPIGSQNNSVPDSCCIQVVEECGCNLFRMSLVAIPDQIFVHGCNDVQIRLLVDDVLPWVPAFSGVLVVITLIEIGLSGLAFFCAKMVWEKENPVEDDGLSLSQNIAYDDSAYQDSRENMMNNFDLIHSPSSPSETMC